MCNQRSKFACLILFSDFHAVRLLIPSTIFLCSYPAERSFPITQSYVDIIMRGCLSISRDFAKIFLETTHGWWHDGDHDKEVVDQTVLNDRGDEKHDIDRHHTWVNDRHNPMYVRADSEYSLQNGSEIDELIKEHHPHALKRRVMSM